MCLVPYLIGHHHDIIHFLVPILFLVVPYPPITTLWPPIYMSFDENLKISVCLLTSMSSQVTALIDSIANITSLDWSTQPTCSWSMTMEFFQIQCDWLERFGRSSQLILYLKLINLLSTLISPLKQYDTWIQKYNNI